MTPVPVYKVGCGTFLFTGCLIIVVGAIALTVLLLIAGYFLTYAIVSGIANLISGRDPEPSDAFLQRWGVAFPDED